MPVNSDTLVHFTNSIDNLKEILQGDFYPRLSLETFEHIGNPSTPLSFAIPMVCFCDIPLHLVEMHMNEYGNYGIGLRKAWGIANGVSPVQYLAEGSNAHFTLQRLYKLIHASSDYNTIRSYWNLLAYTKPYKGTSHKTMREKVFYDEREWRYFPDIFISSGDNIQDILTESEIESKRDAVHARMKSMPLRYKPEDIKYIIVKDEAEIGEVLDHIDQIKGTKYSQRTIAELKTKIIPASYMKDDF